MTDRVLSTEDVPFELRAIDKDAAGVLLGCSGRTVLETYALRPDFPVSVSERPKTWIASEILRYREKLKAGRQARRHPRCNRA